MLSLIQKETYILNGGNEMKGFTVESGYMGYVDGTYILFASESDYREYMGE